MTAREISLDRGNRQYGSGARACLQRLAQILVLVACGASATAPALAASSANAPRLAETACDADITRSLARGYTLRCGYLTVPEHHTEPDGPTLQLAVAVLSPDAAPLPHGTTFFLSGGPGQSSIQLVPRLLTPTSPFRSLVQDRQWVFVDQRGTGLSRPALVCPELRDPTFHTSVESELSSDVDAFVACQDRLTRDGVNFSAFTTAENAADIDDLRAALGLDQVDLYGASYGSRLALEVLRNHSAGVRSAVLDGVYPPQANLYADVNANLASAMHRVFARCAEDAACDSAYPDLELTLSDLLTRLHDNPARVRPSGGNGPIGVDDQVFVSVLQSMLYDRNGLELVPALITGAGRGDDAILARVLGSRQSATEQLSEGMYFSIECSDDGDATTNLDGLPGWLVDRPLGSAERMHDMCAGWASGAQAGPRHEPVSSDVPALLLAGSFDTITSPDYARIGANSLPNSAVVEFAREGHTTMLSGQCAAATIAQFFDDPSQVPDAACAAESAPHFLLPNQIHDHA